MCVSFSYLPCMQEKYGEARSLFESALAIRKEKLGEGHKGTMLTSKALKQLDEGQHVQV